MSALLALIPAAWRPYAKSVVVAVGVIVTAVLATGVEAPQWLTYLSSFLTALGVYAVPNEDPEGDV